MSDDLRTRIAAMSIKHRCCSDCVPTQVDYDLADAVIRELGLRPEEMVVYHSAFPYPLRRYVTDWEEN